MSSRRRLSKENTAQLTNKYLSGGDIPDIDVWELSIRNEAVSIEAGRRIMREAGCENIDASLCGSELWVNVIDAERLTEIKFKLSRLGYANIRSFIGGFSKNEEKSLVVTASKSAVYADPKGLSEKFHRLIQNNPVRSVTPVKTMIALKTMIIDLRTMEDALHVLAMLTNDITKAAFAPMGRFAIVKDETSSIDIFRVRNIREGETFEVMFDNIEVAQ